MFIFGEGIDGCGKIVADFPCSHKSPTKRCHGESWRIRRRTLGEDVLEVMEEAAAVECRLSTATFAILSTGAVGAEAWKKTYWLLILPFETNLQACTLI